MDRKIKLLLVDDNEGWAFNAIDTINISYNDKLYAEFFSSSHQKELHCSTIGEALIKYLCTLKSDRKTLPDVLVIDYAMEGMNGALLIEELKKNSIYIPSLMITAFAEDMMKEAQDALIRGAKSYLFKSEIETEQETFYAALNVTIQRVFQQDQREKWMRLMLETSIDSSEITNLQDVADRFIQKSKLLGSVERCFIGKYDKQNKSLDLLGSEKIPSSLEKSLENIKTDDFIFIKDILCDSHSNVKIFNDLEKDGITSKENILKIFKELGMDRVLIGRIGSTEKPLGTVSFFRSKIDAPFTKIESQYFTLLLSHFENIWKNLERQRHDAEIISLIHEFSNCHDEDEVFELLAKQLHEEINLNDNRTTIISIKQLKSGSNQLRIVKDKHHLGIERKIFSPSIYSNSISSLVFREKKSIIVHNTSKAGDDFVFSVHNVKSSLTVPILVTQKDRPLGVVNLESTQIDYYSENALRYAENLSQLAASHTMRLRIKKFNDELRQLIGENDIEKRIYGTINMIKQFTGYTLFLMVLPDPKNSTQWIIAREDGLPIKFKEQFIQELTREINLSGDPSTHISDCIQKGCEIYIFDKDTQSSKFWQFEGINNKAQDVHILRAGNRIVGAMSLEFNVIDPLSDYQREILGYIANWLGYTFFQLDEFKFLEEQVSLFKKEAAISELMRQVHHAVTGPIHSLNLRLEDMEDAIRENDFESIKRVLRVSKEKLAEINLLPHKLRGVAIKSPEIKLIPISEVWNRAKENLEDKSRILNVRIADLTNSSFKVFADEDILHMVFFHLIDNALNAYSKKFDLPVRKVTIEIIEQDDKLKMYLLQKGW